MPSALGVGAAGARVTAPAYATSAASAAPEAGCYGCERSGPLSASVGTAEPPGHYGWAVLRRKESCTLLEAIERDLFTRCGKQ